MFPNHSPRNGRPDDLEAAESTASRFLDDHREQIAETLRAKAKFIETLVQRIGNKKTGYQERLEYFARISEIARLIEEDADGFFQLASKPVVARILAEVPQR